MPSSKLPKYELIKQDLLREIESQKILPGERFYSEAAIRKKYDVSSTTSVKVLNELSSDGFLYRIQGKGTFVAKPKAAANVHFKDLENHFLENETLKVISMTKESDPEILKELHLSKKQIYYKIIRIRFVKQIPFVLHMIYIPEAFISHPDDPEYYEEIHDQSGLDYAIDLHSPKSIQTYKVVFPTPKDVAQWLQISESEPTIIQARHAFIAENQVLSYQVSYKNWKYFKLELDTSL